MSLKDDPFYCMVHGFVTVIAAEGEGHVRRENCPFCRAEKAEAELERLRTRIMAVIEKVEAEPLAVGGSKESIMLGRLQVADEIRAAIAVKEED